MIKNIKKGQKVFLSCLGHNGFFYPGKKTMTVLYDTPADVPAFVGGGDIHSPIILPENSVLIEGSPDRKIIVWEAKVRASH
tara:strand:+ start:251 stop:493 length:243 start_codon:yes stop_codon:yes gene_type:complete